MYIWENLRVFFTYDSNDIIFVYFLVARWIGNIHTSTKIDHNDHTFYWHFLELGLSIDSPIFNKILIDSILIFFTTKETFRSSEINSTKLTINHIDIIINTMSFFLIKIFNGEMKCIRYKSFHLVQEILPLLFQQMHYYYQFRSVRISISLDIS